VEEFQTWGPVKRGKPVKSKAGETFQKFISQLKSIGYHVEYRELVASDYGAPTSRKRFFLIARCDGNPIVWPSSKYGDPKSLPVIMGVQKPWRTASEIIDWTIPCPSIFERKKPLVENTLNRIARGLKKFVVDDPEPFTCKIGNEYIVTPFLSQYHSYDNNARGHTLKNPLLTLDASNRYTSTGARVDKPVATITSNLHIAAVYAFLIKYYGQEDGQSLTSPLDTITGHDRFGLVTVKGNPYQIVDIGMRMLTPRELYSAQGFPADYIIEHDYTGKTYPKSKQVARCGNAVPPPFATALVKANWPESCNGVEITTMNQLFESIYVRSGSKLAMARDKDSD